jgi:hypothetical protein
MGTSFKVRRNSVLKRELGAPAVAFLEHAVGALTRLLPHVETEDWVVTKDQTRTRAAFVDQTRRSLSLQLSIRLPTAHWTIRGRLTRRHAPAGVGAIARTIALRERDIASSVLSSIEDVLSAVQHNSAETLLTLRANFDERAVARHLNQYFKLGIDIASWFAALRQLAEQSYENKSMSFGCLIDTLDVTKPPSGVEFPDDFLSKKKYRALSDGYRTAYLVSGSGALIGFARIGPSESAGRGYFPEWCEDLAFEARRARMAICLTRQGDLLVLSDGQLTFSYRLGRWQYWNHAHIIDLIRNVARVQNVPPNALADVVRSLYRAALDVSFRRSGGLFVLLRNRNNTDHIVRNGDAIGDRSRDSVDEMFDRAVSSRKVMNFSRAILSELAGLDGAVVIANTGTVLAYGAVLEPDRRRGIVRAEGSRTKAAIGASHYGLAIKVSSDGDITVYVNGQPLLSI